MKHPSALRIAYPVNKGCGLVVEMKSLLVVMNSLEALAKILIDDSNIILFIICQFDSFKKHLNGQLKFLLFKVNYGQLIKWPQVILTHPHLEPLFSLLVYLLPMIANTNDIVYFTFFLYIFFMLLDTLLQNFYCFFKVFLLF